MSELEKGLAAALICAVLFTAASWAYLAFLAVSELQ
jgi:hypothetical protein